MVPIIMEILSLFINCSTRTEFSRAHTSTKATDVAKVLLLNKCSAVVPLCIANP